MSGLSDYLAEAVLNFASGQSPMPALASRFLALFTTAPTSDAGTGGTEVAGGGYARVQVAGGLAAGASWTTSSTTITMAAAIQSWVVAGMNVYDTTNGQQIGLVASVSGAMLTLAAAAAHASSGSSDNLVISAWPAASASSGNEPSTSPANVANGAVISFPQASASWGTVAAWGLYDNSSGGNLLTWDYLGNYKWVPFSCSSASPGVLTCDSAADAPANGSSIVVSAKFGGTLPATSGSWAGILTTAGLAGATFTAGVSTTSIGGGLLRQVTQQPIAANITAQFAASTFTLTAA